MGQLRELLTIFREDLGNRENLEAYVAILLAVVFAVLGIFGVVSTEILGAVILLALSFLVFNSLANRRTIKRFEAAVNEIRAPEESLVDAVRDIQQMIGLSVSFTTDMPREAATGEIYRQATEIIQKAEKNIWGLWYQRTPSWEEANRSKLWHDRGTGYHELLLKKCYEHRQENFFYHRVLQIQEAHTIKDGLIPSQTLTPTMRNHCKGLLKFIEENPHHTALLKYSPVFLAQVFVLVDNRYVLWEIDATDPTIGKDYMDGLLIFEDREGRFANYLKDFFRKVDAHAAVVKQIVD